jgi:preprotein translocase subunit SecB
MGIAGSAGSKEADFPMTDTETEAPFKLIRSYLKDMSFESPMGAKRFLSEEEPKVTQELNLEVFRLGPKAWEVVVIMLVTMKLGDSTALLIEAHQAGVIGTEERDHEVLRKMFKEDVANAIFPMLCETITVLTASAGFPKLVFEAVDFTGMWRDTVLKTGPPDDENPMPEADS